MKTHGLPVSEYGPNRSIDVASLSLESDSSVHSYTLHDIVVAPVSDTNPLGGTPVSITSVAPEVVPPTPVARSAFASYRERMGEKSTSGGSSGLPGLPPPPPTPPMTPQGSGALTDTPSETPSERLRRRVRPPLKMSIELPRGMEGATIDAIADNATQARLVRRRRRLPLSLIIFFGCVSCYCGIVGTLALCFGAYNFSKIRLNRGSEAIDRLRQTLMPILNEIRERLDGRR